MTFIPKDKMGKKARRKLDLQQRLTWQVHPATRTFESTNKKRYSRKRKSHEYLDEWTWDFLCYNR